MDTIFALATVPGKSGVAVIRVSGPEAAEACAVFGFPPPPARQARLRELVHAERGLIDQALVLFFEDGASFTGEPVVEFHIHGSLAAIQAVLSCLLQVPSFRPAEAGEFTRRALLNGKLDLTEVEALSDLIDAETEMQRKQALSGFTGRVKEAAERWRTDLITALSLLEVTIDFADEEIPVDVSGDVRTALISVMSELRREIDGFGAAERIRTGFEVAIVGAPNAGKSTLLNYLAGRDAAITSDIAGTTRDVIEVRMDVGGLAVTFLDTAGLRNTEDVVERLGIERAVERAKKADLRVFLTDGSMPGFLAPLPEDLVAEGKSDLRPGSLGISGVTGEGVPHLLDHVRKVLEQRVAGAGLVAHDRQRACLVEALGALERSLDIVDKGPEFYDLASEELRQAVFALENLVGRVDVEDVLDKVFSSFCIGK